MPTNTTEQTKKTNSKRRKFEHLSVKMSEIVGSPYWFFGSLVIVLVWFPLGFFIGFGEIWHLLINTLTTILTFLMMSLLHSSQNKWERQMEAIQKRQDRTLKILEAETHQILNPNNMSTQNSLETLSKPTKDTSQEQKNNDRGSISITSLL